MEITIRPGLFDHAAGDPVEFGFDQFTHEITEESAPSPKAQRPCSSS
jgi:hypothetical protein